MPLWSSPEDEIGLNERQLRELMCEIGKRCYESGYNDANGGNLSVRLDDERVLCTPTMISKGFMEPSDLVVVDLDGNQLDGRRKKSSEILIHLYCLKRRPDINAVLHGHPRNATAFAVTSTPVPKCVMPEIEVLVGEVPIAAYGDVGTMRLAETLEPYVNEFYVLLMANHGALAMGSGLIDAFWKMQIVDAYCDTVIKALSLGPLTQVANENMEHIFGIKKAVGLVDRRIDHPDLASCSVPAPVTGQPSGAPTPTRPSSTVIPAVDESVLRQIVEKVVDRISTE